MYNLHVSFFIHKSMNKIYYLSSCDTCKKIIKDLKLKEHNFLFQDIKSESITELQLDEMKKIAGSYESLFSKIARKYKEIKLSGKVLTELDYKNYILNEYFFLKRPGIFIRNKLFIGSSKTTIDLAKQELEN